MILKPSLSMTLTTYPSLRNRQSWNRYNTRAHHLPRRIQSWSQCRIQGVRVAVRHSSSIMNGEPKLETVVLPVDVRNIGRISAVPTEDDLLDEIHIELDSSNIDAANLRLAAHRLKDSDVPVAFPTETVYGLGADATRSAAVNGIYKAKQRPSDNPLIVHFASLKQLRTLLKQGHHSGQTRSDGSSTNGVPQDPIPPIYKPLIARFWPGPLTIILPNPSDSSLAPEVTAGLKTFGARIPRNVLALALIKLADVPVAAPSANASTKPSPTAAEHVAYDLEGRIEVIIDGGPCDVGVESTVVDGLSKPPAVLRPGGISIEQLRSCPGWENTRIGYKNVAEHGSQPQAPGMKYRHYSPKAPVLLSEAGEDAPTLSELCSYLGSSRKLGIITTKRWMIEESAVPTTVKQVSVPLNKVPSRCSIGENAGFAGMLEALSNTPDARAALRSHNIQHQNTSFRLLDIALGPETAGIARGIFSALRELDRENVDAIFVEGIDEFEGETAAAVMNRLRKAAEIK